MGSKRETVWCSPVDPSIIIVSKGQEPSPIHKPDILLPSSTKGEEAWASDLPSQDKEAEQSLIWADSRGGDSISCQTEGCTPDWGCQSAEGFLGPVLSR